MPEHVQAMCRSSGVVYVVALDRSRRLDVLLPCARTLRTRAWANHAGFPANRGMAPGGVEPPRTDSKSVALSAELRGPAHERGWRMGLEPTTTWTTTRGSTN